MRTSLFLSTLVAVSLVGGLAMADKGAEKLNAQREHGDQVEKSYRHDARAPSSTPVASEAKTTAGSATKPGAIDKGASRINCSADGADCAASHGRAATAQRAPGATSQATSSSKSPADKLDQKASARTNCNEADQCSASSRAAQSVWGQHGVNAARTLSPFQGTAGESKAVPGAVSRLRDQQSAPKADAACDEGEPYVSSKAAKQWNAYEAVKKGTFVGPVDTSGAGATEKNAERAVKAMKAEKHHD